VVDFLAGQIACYTLHSQCCTSFSGVTTHPLRSGYLGAVRQFAEHFHCSPEQLGPEQLRQYQRYLLQEKKLEPSTAEMRISALRFLYKRTLKRGTQRSRWRDGLGVLVSEGSHAGLG